LAEIPSKLCVNLNDHFKESELTVPILNKLTGAFPTALTDITAGTLIMAWTVVYWTMNTPETGSGHFWVTGFLLTGISLLAIGLLLGKIGQAARGAELPPSEVVSAAVQADLVAPRVVQATQPVATVSGVPMVAGTAAVAPVPTVT
jgi:hypothetical protein